MGFICIQKINGHCPDTGKTTENGLEICRAAEENTTNTIGRSLLSTFYNSLRSELIKEEQIYVTFYHCLIDNKKIVNEKEIANRGIPDLLLACDVIIQDTSFLKSLFTIETTKQAR